MATDYEVGQTVTVRCWDEDEWDTITGTITGFHDVDGEKGFWLKYEAQGTERTYTLISWWRLSTLVAPDSHPPRTGHDDSTPTSTVGPDRP